MAHATYLDTEFNGFGGALISLGLSCTDGSEFYGEIAVVEPVDRWVRAHVLPRLQDQIEPKDLFKFRLWQFLQARRHLPIYADWPEDFVHLLQCLCETGGRMPEIELQMRLIKRVHNLRSAVPHHALSDARALKAWHQGQITVAAVEKAAAQI